MTYKVILKVDGKYQEVEINANDKLGAEWMAVTSLGGVVVDRRPTGKEVYDVNFDELR
jgi:hypothetical protein